MSDRAKKRVGRIVEYNPSAAEVTSNGDGPWAGVITAVNADGTVDLNVAPRTVAAITATAIATADADAATSPDGSDAGTTQTLANELKADYNLAVTLINELKARLDEALPALDSTRKLAVPEGSGGSTFSFIAGAHAV